MNIENLLRSYRKRYSPNGCFELLPKESIIDTVANNQVPNKYGIYIFSGKTKFKAEIIYIGRAGTINQDGTFKKQGIGKRLTMKQSGMYRENFFQKVIEDFGYEALSFEWFVTYNESNNILPGFAEAELLQAFFDDFGQLPRLNKSI